MGLSLVCGRVGGDCSFLPGRHQTIESGREWLRPLHLQGQAESQLGACLLLLSYFFTQHFVKLKFKVLNERSDNESSPRRIQWCPYGACKRPLDMCASLYFFQVPVAFCAIYKNVLFYFILFFPFIKMF